jgi:predicted ATPase
VLEAQFPETAATAPALLAHHALRGELWNEALAYLRQAGEQAVARSAYREAVAAFEQALATIQHLPESHATRLGRLYGQSGRRAPARAALSAAMALYRDMDMAFWLPQAEAALAQVETTYAPG